MCPRKMVAAIVSDTGGIAWTSLQAQAAAIAIVI